MDFGKSWSHLYMVYLFVTVQHTVLGDDKNYSASPLCYCSGPENSSEIFYFSSPSVSSLLQRSVAVSPIVLSQSVTSFYHSVGSLSQSVGSLSQIVDSSYQSVGPSSQSIGSLSQIVDIFSSKSVISPSQIVDSSYQSVGPSSQSIGSLSQIVDISSSQSVDSSYQSVGSLSQSVGSPSQSVDSSYQSVGSLSQSVGPSSQSIDSSYQSVGSLSQSVGSPSQIVNNSYQSVWKSAENVQSSSQIVWSSGHPSQSVIKSSQTLPLPSMHLRLCICPSIVSTILPSAISSSKHQSNAWPSSSVAQKYSYRTFTIINNQTGNIMDHNIAITGISSTYGLQMQHKGRWFYVLSKLSKKKALLIRKGERIRFQHLRSKATSYEPIFMNFTFIDEKLINSKSNSRYFNSAAQSSSNTLILLILPLRPFPTFDSDLKSVNISIKEDSKCAMFTLNKISHDLQKPIIASQTVNDTAFLKIPDINTTVVGQYMTHLRSFLENSFYSAYSVKYFTYGYGRWFYGINENNTKPFYRTMTFNGSDYNICFVPRSNYFGDAKMIVAPAFIKKSDKTVYGGQGFIVINVKIMPVNDRPKQGASSSIKMPYLPFNASLANTNGFLVSSIMSQKDRRGKVRKAFTDVDGDTIGIGIVSAVETKYGFWEYKCAGGSWIKLDSTFTPPLPTVKDLEVVLLTPNDYLRFTLNGSKFWKVVDAQNQNIGFKAVAWDQTDNRTCGNFSYNNTLSWPESFSSQESVVTALQLRIGCDGKAGTDAVIDQCGECGGKNKKCSGCDGVINSGATYDSCRICTGGTTNLTRNYLLDCNNKCKGEWINNTDTCGVCEHKDRVRNHTDCSGVCFGGAKNNKCQQCVGGNTGKSLNAGMDECGVCAGDNSTCVDCAGVPNGKKLKDLCGSCLLSTDSTYNTGCVEFGLFKPTVVYGNQVNVKITLKASGLTSSSKVACNFVDGIVSSTAATGVTIKSKNVIIPMPSLTAGKKYSISCNVVGSAAKTANGDLTVVDNAAISVSSISPSVVYYNESANVTVTGTGFMDTSELICLFVKGNYMKKLTAEFITATNIKCHVLPMKRSVSGKLVLSFVSHNRKANLLLNSYFHRSINVPTIESGKFSKNFAALILTFSQRIQLVNKGTGCQDIFPLNYGTFGSRARCRASGAKLRINLIGAPTFTPTDLQMNLTTIKYIGADYTVYPFSTQNVTISAPINSSPPDFKLLGPSKIGPCANIRFIAKVRGGSGGRKMTYDWHANWGASNSGSPNADQVANLTSINDTLSSYTKQRVINIKKDSMISLLPAYVDIVVTATNFLGKSTTKTATFLRENKNLPTVVVRMTKESYGASDIVKVKAKVRVSPCVSNKAVTYLWTLYNSDGSGVVGVDYSQNYAVLIIDSNSLQGGNNYTATVSIAMQSDSSLSTVASAYIIIDSLPLRAVISGPQTVGSNQLLTFRAKYSSDPDNDKFNTPKYLWGISGSDGGTVIKNGKQITEFLDITSETFNINVTSFLESGQTYNIELGYSIGTRVSVAEQKVKVFAGSPPSIKPILVTNTINPSRKIGFQAQIKSKTQVTELTWEAEGVEGVKVGDNRVSSYILDKDVLSGGMIYTFTISATNFDGTSTSDLIVKTNSNPTAGLIELSPTSGTSLDTEFKWTASEGWSDADGDDILFIFGYMNNGAENDLGPKTSSTSFEGILPAGNLTLYIKCFDAYGGFSKSEIEVSVIEAPITDAAFESFSTDSLSAVNSGDFDKFFGSVLAIMGQIMGFLKQLKRKRRSIENSNTCDSLSQSTIDFQANSADLALQTYENGGLQDDAAITIFMGTLTSATNCASVIFDSALITRIYTSLTTVLGTLVKKTATEVESDLKIYDNIINPIQYDTSQQNAKGAFKSSADKQGQSMCLNLLTGESPIVAKRSLAVIQAVKLTFDNVAVNFTKLGCDDCPDNIKAPDYVRLGTSLKAKYDNTYTCGESECIGACVTSVQYINDLYSPSLNSSIMSSVLDIKLWDPELSLTLNVSDIPSGMEVKMVATKTTNNSYVCLRWDTDSSSWTEDGVDTLTVKSFVLNNNNYVHCNVTTLGPLALFEGPEIIEPTVSSSTIMPTSSVNYTSSNMSSTAAPTQPTTTTTLAPDDYPTNVTFKFPFNNCTSTLNNASTVSSVTSSLKTQIGALTKVSENSMRNFSLSCGSLIVTFIQIHTVNMTTKQAVAALQAAINNNQLNVTINGQTLSVDQTSFASVILTPSYVTTTVGTTVSTADDGLSGGAIAGIVIGVLILLIIVVVVVYMLCCKKKSRKDPRVEPNDNDVELRGKSNDAYQGSP